MKSLLMQDSPCHESSRITNRSKNHRIVSLGGIVNSEFPNIMASGSSFTNGRDSIDPHGSNCMFL